MKKFNMITALIFLSSSAYSYSSYDIGYMHGDGTFLFGGHPSESPWGFYMSIDLFSPEDNYELGGLTTVCNDGGLTNSTGSGTCSWHGGISHTSESTYSRFAYGAGPIFKITDKLSVYGTLDWVTYQQVTTIGSYSRSYQRYGFQTGVSYEILPYIKASTLYATERNALRLGVIFAIPMDY